MTYSPGNDNTAVSHVKRNLAAAPLEPPGALAPHTEAGMRSRAWAFRVWPHCVAIGAIHGSRHFAPQKTRLEARSWPQESSAP